MPDKPGHILDIPDSLGRDVDKARAGKLKGGLPVEAFMSDAALEQVARQNKAAEPVHAEALTPITPAEAARRTTFDGEHLPDVPQVRRVIPAPFRRPRVNGGGHGKSWQYVSPREVVIGDLVPDVGLVSEEPQEQTVYATRGAILGLEAAQVAEDDVLLATDISKEIDPGDLSEEIAVGVVVIIKGGDQQVKAFRENDQVRVFRKVANA
jgi:hypothetical protein